MFPNVKRLKSEKVTAEYIVLDLICCKQGYLKKEEDFPPNFSFLSSSSSPPPRTDSAERSPGKINEKKLTKLLLTSKLLTKLFIFIDILLVLDTFGTKSIAPKLVTKQSIILSRKFSWSSVKQIKERKKLPLSKSLTK